MLGLSSYKRVGLSLFTIVFQKVYLEEKEDRYAGFMLDVPYFFFFYIYYHDFCLFIVRSKGTTPGCFCLESFSHGGFPGFKFFFFLVNSFQCLLFVYRSRMKGDRPFKHSISLYGIFKFDQGESDKGGYDCQRRKGNQWSWFLVH